MPAIRVEVIRMDVIMIHARIMEVTRTESISMDVIRVAEIRIEVIRFMPHSPYGKYSAPI